MILAPLASHPIGVYPQLRLTLVPPRPVIPYNAHHRGFWAVHDSRDTVVALVLRAMVYEANLRRINIEVTARTSNEASESRLVRMSYTKRVQTPDAGSRVISGLSRNSNLTLTLNDRKVTANPQEREVNVHPPLRGIQLNLNKAA